MRRQITALVLAGSAVAGLAACGGGGDGGGSTGSGAPALGGLPATPGSVVPGAGGDYRDGRRGGLLTVHAGPDVAADSLAQLAAVDRPLYTYAPPAYDRLVPDTAAGDPVVSRDGLTVTVKLRPDLHFAPPVGRTITAADVGFGISRVFTAHAADPQAARALSLLKGADAFADGKARSIAGLQTPDERTLVFTLSRPAAGAFLQALTLTATAPVPREYASKFDRENPSTYPEHAVATGPYMLKAGTSGRITGRKADGTLELVRNPSWRRKSDFRPAYADAITIVPATASKATTTVREALDARGTVVVGLTPPAADQRRLARGPLKDQLASTPDGTVRFVVLNASAKPLDDADVRKAVSAALDRGALRRAFGGAQTGEVATHLLGPGVPGFVAAGGTKGLGLDWLADTGGDRAVASRYLKAAGFASGRYTGRTPVVLAGAATGPGAPVARSVRRQLQRLGFTVELRTLGADALAAACRPGGSAAVAVCAGGAATATGQDPQALLDPAFARAGGGVAGAIEQGAGLAAPDTRARHWADVDRRILTRAEAVPWLWDTAPLARSKDVVSVASPVSGAWDLPFTSVNNRQQ